MYNKYNKYNYSLETLGQMKTQPISRANPNFRANNLIGNNYKNVESGVT